VKKIMKNQTGVTLIETIAAAAIIAIIMVTVLGALLYGQKMVVFNDSKNNEAAQAQEVIDNIMAQLGSGTGDQTPTIDGATNVNGVFFVPGQPSDSRKEYYYVPVNLAGETTSVANAVGYHVYVRVYYNNDQSFVDLEAFTKKGSVFQ